MREAASAKTGEGIKERGIKNLIIHPHPSPLPSRERGIWMESISFLGTLCGE
jgi:hypothetical protein